MPPIDWRSSLAAGAALQWRSQPRAHRACPCFAGRFTVRQLFEDCAGLAKRGARCGFGGDQLQPGGPSRTVFSVRPNGWHQTIRDRRNPPISNSSDSYILYSYLSRTRSRTRDANSIGNPFDRSAKASAAIEADDLAIRRDAAAAWRAGCRCCDAAPASRERRRCCDAAPASGATRQCLASRFCQLGSFSGPGGWSKVCEALGPLTTFHPTQRFFSRVREFQSIVGIGHKCLIIRTNVRVCVCVRGVGVLGAKVLNLVNLIP